MNEYKQGYDNGWADCLKNKRALERGVLEDACLRRMLSTAGSHSDLLQRLIDYEVAVAIDFRRVCDITIAQKR